MTNYWEKLKEAYEYFRINEQEKADIIFNELYTELISLDYKSEENLKVNLISCILWLGEINMKKWNFGKALEYYEVWNNITSWKDFNVLFNLWVVYRNLWQEKKSYKILDEAKKIEPNNSNLIRFLNEMSGINSENDNWNKIIKNFIEHRIEEDFINWGKRLYIVIYSICTFKCCFCVKWTDEYKIKFKGTDTNLIQIKELLNEINLDEIKTITIWWSEPLTNSNIDDILYFLDSFWKNIEIHTSWSEKWKIQLMLNLKNLKQVILPIYWTKSVIHDKIVWLKWAYNDLEEIKKILINNNIKVVFHKLLIKDNFLDTEYIDNSKSFSLLHPRDKDLYIKNAILLTDLFSKVLDENDVNSILNLYKLQWIPICFMLPYILKKDDKNFIIKEVINLSSEIKEKNINENKSSYCTKPEKCKKCILNEYCLGYFKYYFDKFWDYEVNPI